MPNMRRGWRGRFHRDGNFVLASVKSSMPNGRTVGGSGSHGMLLDLIRTGEATTRGELANATGLSRSTVAVRVEHLLAEGLIAEVGEAPSSGGRPPAVLGLNQEAGVVLAVDLGATHARVAITDLGATPIAERALDLDIASGPENVLGTIDRVLISSARYQRAWPGRSQGNRDRRAGTGRVRRGESGDPTDHARLGRVSHTGPLRGPISRAGAGGQRRQHHGQG